MEIDFAFLADAAETVNGKIYVLGGAFDTIWAPQIPVAHPSLSFIMRLLLSPGEIGRRHKLELSLMNADGRRLNTINGEFQVDSNPNNSPGSKQGFMTVFNFKNLNLPNYGDYSFEILINEFSLKSLSLKLAHTQSTSR